MTSSMQHDPEAAQGTYQVQYNSPGCLLRPTAKQTINDRDNGVNSLTCRDRVYCWFYIEFDLARRC